METILAVYEQGRLRPLKPLQLRENETVSIQVMSVSDDSDAALRALVEAGLVKLASGHPHPANTTPTERVATAEALGKAGPVSELILRDRE